MSLMGSIYAGNSWSLEKLWLLYSFPSHLLRPMVSLLFCACPASHSHSLPHSNQCSRPKQNSTIFECSLGSSNFLVRHMLSWLSEFLNSGEIFDIILHPGVSGIYWITRNLCIMKCSRTLLGVQNQNWSQYEVDYSLFYDYVDYILFVTFLFLDLLTPNDVIHWGSNSVFDLLHKQTQASLTKKYTSISGTKSCLHVRESHLFLYTNLYCCPGNKSVSLPIQLP